MNDSEIIAGFIKGVSDSVTEKIGEAPAKTFNSLWDIAFGGVDSYAEKLAYKRTLDVQNFKNSLEDKIMAIPENNVQEPEISLLGPALESTKYYISDESLRELFINLIAKSMDDRYNNKAHHSFVEIIKQMSPIDAEFFSRIGISQRIVSAKIIKIYENGSQSDVTDHFVQAYGYDRELIQLTINNLKRLGLIELDTLSPAHPESLYDTFYEDEYFKELELESQVTYFDKFTVDIVKSRISITSLGKAMFDVCVV